MSKLRYLLLLIVLVGCSANNPEPTMEERRAEVIKRFAEMENKNLTQEYAGVFTDEGKIEGLYPIYATGISTEPILNAANLFLGSLSSEQLESVSFEIDSDEWRKWSNVDNGIYIRQGMSLKVMNEDQKALAFGLMQASLSAKGLQLSKDIMKTDQTLRELNDNSPHLDEELYFFTFMGKPSATEPWGWQLDGHHLNINYFVLGDQVVMSPVFMGGEPIITTTGKYAGNTLFQDEQNLGLTLMRLLNEEQQSKATLQPDKTENNTLAAANKDNLTLNYEGIQVSEFDEEQKQALIGLMAAYITNMREGHSRIRMDEINKHIDATWFAWVGDTSEDAVFYYRIHSPVVLIEFDHQRPVGNPNAEPGKPTRQHIHTIVRSPNGNDYGKDLLRQHLETHEH